MFNFFFFDSDNVLVGPNGDLKIADFGYATQLTVQRQV